MHGVGSIFHIRLPLTASGNIFGIMSDTREIAIAVSRASLICQDIFTDAFFLLGLKSLSTIFQS